MRCVKVAFGMEDDETLVDAHYGDSKFFAVYRICEDGSAELIEKRPNRALEVEERMHGDPKKLEVVMDQLRDADVLAAFRMGPNFLRIKENRLKAVFFTRTRDLKLALKRLLDSFDEVWKEVEACGHR
ncbi:MAG: dinitrogenase iron-molybdenum cofactor [Thermococci archaeon]|nr:dinitrogenase iron-molybdenum cofactor [Thermococci archaeon]